MRTITIRPELFRSERLADVSRDARLLLIGMWAMTDRDGKLENRPKLIRAGVFPYDDDINVPALLLDLEATGAILMDAASIALIDPFEMFCPTAFHTPGRYKWQSLSRKLRPLVIERDGGVCQYCGRSGDFDIHIDHRIPLSRGGTNDLSNLVTACRECNTSKHARTPGEWGVQP